MLVKLENDSSWILDTVEGGAAGIHFLAEKYNIKKGLLHGFDNKIVGRFGAVGSALSLITAGTSIFTAGRNSYLEGNSKNKIIRDGAGEAAYQVTKSVVKSKVCKVGAKVGAKAGAKVGAAIGSVFPGVGTVIGAAGGAVIGGAIGYLASSWAIDNGMGWLRDRIRKK
jgi:hypothetical protein